MVVLDDEKAVRHAAIVVRSPWTGQPVAPWGRGLLLAGDSPAQVAMFQLLVLIGLLAAEAVAAVTATTLLAPEVGRVKPLPPS